MCILIFGVKNISEMYKSFLDISVEPPSKIQTSERPFLVAVDVTDSHCCSETSCHLDGVLLPGEHHCLQMLIQGNPPAPSSVPLLYNNQHSRGPVCN